jgi:MFS family permease
MNLHAMDFWLERGFTHAQTSAVSVVFSASLATSALLAGLVVDRSRAKMQLGGLCFLALALCMHASQSGAVASPRALLVFYVVYGCVTGFNGTLSTVLVADLFGRKAVGAITAVQTASTTLMSGVGPVVFGLCKERRGSYGPVALALSCCCGAGGVLFLLSPSALAPVDADVGRKR